MCLKHASKMLDDEEGSINNIDAVIICEKPKISEHSEKIQENIAKILKISKQKISIKGKTSESIGFIGRNEGIAVIVNTAIKIKEKI